jgi:hypothetical protein
MHNKQLFTVNLYPLHATHQTTVGPHTDIHQMHVLCITLWQHTQGQFTEAAILQIRIISCSCGFMLKKTLPLLSKY